MNQFFLPFFFSQFDFNFFFALNSHCIFQGYQAPNLRVEEGKRVQVIKCNEKKKIICEFIEAWTNSRAKLRDIIQFMYEKN
jgi:hypothetical protein